VNVVETEGLGRRYGATWALRDCTLEVPEGRLVALVGPNGAGKSTLLNLVMGLTAPTEGRVTVLGGTSAGSPEALDGVGYVAQDMPLHRSYSVADTVHLARNLNRVFDSGYAWARLDELGLDRRQRAGSLSGGQRAQLALTLALARHPRLLVLDEPTAPLDPLARHDFMATVMAAMADDGLSVVLSSHLLSELERVADHLVLIAGGLVRVDGAVDDLLARHRMVTTRSGPMPQHPDWEVVESSAAGAQTHQLIRLRRVDADLALDGEARAVGIEELTMAYLRESAPRALPVLDGATR
jgi:ABC-2 type transport system ATP-binding protein